VEQHTKEVPASSKAREYNGERMGSAVGITRWIITVLAKWGRFLRVPRSFCSPAVAALTAIPVPAHHLGEGDERRQPDRFVDTQLSQPLVAQLLDASGAPIEGATVTFAVSEGGGSLFVSVATSDASGYVRDNWTLGSMVTLQQVQVRGVSSNGTRPYMRPSPPKRWRVHRRN